jgi:hypothetical protein
MYCGFEYRIMLALRSQLVKIPLPKNDFLPVAEVKHRERERGKKARKERSEKERERERESERGRGEGGRGGGRER